MERKLIAQGIDARGRDYQLYDYGDPGWSSKTINGMPSSGRPYRYVCLYCGGRVFTFGNDRDTVVNRTKRAAEESTTGIRGRFSMVV